MSKFLFISIFTFCTIAFSNRANAISWDTEKTDNTINLLVTLTVTNPSTFCGTGSISSSVSGGSQPYTYQWSNGATTANISQVFGGSYTLTVFDATGLSQTASATIIQPLQPFQPTIECWETATFNNTTCQWDVTGTQPPAPNVECYETATFNIATCQWDVTGYQPIQPVTECYETASFDPSTCSWIVTGTMPEEPIADCWETFQFNTVTCTYNVSYLFPQISATFNGINNGLATFSTSTQASNVTYQWETLNGVWTELSNDATYSGVNSPVLNVQLSGNVVNQQQFRCTITLDNCDRSSNTVQLVFAPQITNLSATLLCPTGSGTLTITGSNFANVTGVSFGSQPAQSFTVNNQNTITASYPAQTNSQSIVVTTLSGSATSAPYEILTFSISQLPDNTNDNAISYEAISNSPTNNYQWQSNIGFGYQSLSNVGQYSGVNSNVLTVSNLTALNNNQLVRCINTVGGCSLTSASLTINTEFDFPPTSANNNPLPGISYQAVVRDASGAIFANQPINVRFTIHDETATGAIEYVETSSATTNAFGLFTQVLGSGTPATGNFNGIQWSNSDKFLQVEVDFGQGFVDIGTQQMLSVPFAKLSEKSRSLEVQSLPVFETNTQALSGGLAAGQIYRTSNGDIRVVF